MERLLSEEGSKKLVYLGDGSGDYCPSLKLREGDHVMARKNYPLWDLISGNPKLIRAKIHEWTDGADVERILVSLIHTTISNNGDNNDGSAAAQFFTTTECKLETMPVSAHETFPQALPVPF